MSYHEDLYGGLIHQGKAQMGLGWSSVILNIKVEENSLYMNKICT
jgi:hypothetical protein